MDNSILFLVIFLIISFFFAGLNFILKRNNENYGVFCGRYNLHPSNARNNCIKDSNCKWKNFNDSGSGKKVSWCSDNPSNAVILTKKSDLPSDSVEQPIPTWIFESSSGRWITPKQNTLIGDWSMTNIKNSTIMTITFWLNIKELNSQTRSIFHVTSTNNDNTNIGDRTPGLWIRQNITNLVVRNDSTTTLNLGISESTYTPTLNTPVFVTIVYNTTTLSLYINAALSDTISYSPALQKASSNSKFYISDPWWISTGYKIKDFSLYDSALSEKNIKMIYNNSRNNN
jgi:hypothetical protein